MQKVIGLKNVMRSHISTVKGYLKPSHNLANNREQARINSSLNMDIRKVKYQNIYFYNGREIFLKSQKWDNKEPYLVEEFVYKKEFSEDKNIELVK